MRHVVRDRLRYGVGVLLCVLLGVSLSGSVPQASAQAAITATSWAPSNVWGQAYSANVGWINFFCENGEARPVTAPVGPQFMQDGCAAGQSYGVTAAYNQVTQTYTLSGVAYSPNAGYLDMTGVQLGVASAGVRAASGQTSGGYFGTTSFGAGGNVPGVSYVAPPNPLTPYGEFRGVAYSTEIGFISFCNGSAACGSVPAVYAGPTQYGVYMSDTIGNLNCVVDPLAQASWGYGSVGAVQQAIREKTVCTTMDDIGCWDGGARVAPQAGVGSSEVTVSAPSGAGVYTVTVNNGLNTGTCTYAFPAVIYAPGGESNGECSIGYSTTSTTPNPVTATVNCPNILGGAGACGTQSVSFDANGVRRVDFQNALGQRASCHAEVTWIDRRMGVNLSATTCTSDSTNHPTNDATWVNGWSSVWTRWSTSEKTCRTGSGWGQGDNQTGSCGTGSLSQSVGYGEGLNRTEGHSVGWTDEAWGDTGTYVANSTSCGSDVLQGMRVSDADYAAWCANNASNVPSHSPESCLSYLENSTNGKTYYGSFLCAKEVGYPGNTYGNGEVTTWLSQNSAVNDAYDACVNGSGGERRVGQVASCHRMPWWTPTSGSSNGRSCTAAGKHVDLTPPVADQCADATVYPASPGAYGVQFADGNRSRNWTEATRFGLTVTASCRDGLSGCATRYQSGTTGGNGGTGFSFSDTAGNGTSCSANVAKVDTTAPVFVEGQLSPNRWKVFDARNSYSFILHFLDQASGGQMGGIRYVRVRVTDQYGTVVVDKSQHIGGKETQVQLPFTAVPFKKSGPVAVEYWVRDVAENERHEVLNDFFHVVATTPDPAHFQTSFTSGAKVADATDGQAHRATVVLRDQFDNVVVSESGLKEVKAQLVFTNTTRLNQISGTGDSTRFFTTETFVNGSPAQNPGGTESPYMVETNTACAVGASSCAYSAPGDGAYGVSVASYAPTSSGYTPIVSDGFGVQLSGVRYEVMRVGSWSDMGQTTTTSVPTGSVSGTSVTTQGGVLTASFGGAPAFAFSPALTGTPKALNFSNGAYIEEPNAVSNITINAEKRYRLDLQNNSTTQTTSNQFVGFLMDASAAAVTWGSGYIEQAFSYIANEVFTLDAESSFTDSDTYWKALSGAHGSNGAGGFRQIRFKAVPQLATGSTAPASFQTQFGAYLRYTVNGKEVRHRSEPLVLSGAGTLCGNSTVDTGETCATCPSDLGVARCSPCGNGTLNVGEQCDAGASNGSGYCTASCQLSGSTCGNGTQEAYEQCDDRNTASGDGCSAVCRLETTVPATCGNGTQTVGESCDDGNLTAGDGCSATCQVEYVPPVVTCGNGQIDGNENCLTCPADVGACVASVMPTGLCVTDPTNPACIGTASLQIIGTAESSRGIYSNLSGATGRETQGDITRAEMRSEMLRRIASLRSLADSSCQNAAGITITGTDADGNFVLSGGTGCRMRGDSIVLIDGGASSTVTIDVGAPRNTLLLPDKPVTLVLYGQNLVIRNNLAYPAGAREASFGVIALKDENGVGGNIYLHSTLTNGVGALFADGGVVSVNSAGNYWESTQVPCPTNGSDGFCDRTSELKNQLFWEGVLATVNTLGGSDKATPECPQEIQSWCDAVTGAEKRQRARLYDLNYLRTFTPASGGVRAGGIGVTQFGTTVQLPVPPDGSANNNASIIRYGSRVKTNPPPLFEAEGGGNSGEVK